MTPEQRFLNQPKHFWANVRTISEANGYASRRTKRDPVPEIRVPTLQDMERALRKYHLGSDHIIARGGGPTELGARLLEYFEYRAERLMNHVEPRLMNAERARKEFRQLRRQFRPRCPLPMNKQKHEKQDYAFLTCIINMLVERHSSGGSCDYDPHRLTTVTMDDAPLRTLARRVDGAFPTTVNPKAIWEIKEYYHTTTFGSRVADGVYESLLDGMELEEIHEEENIRVKHYLMVDSHYTWWGMGKSYLCRIIDMLHMGYLDEALFGYEVIERLPKLVMEWQE